MRITLHDFCQVSATFAIKDEGIVLISGTSGIGKTTILEAIYFAFFGTCAKNTTKTKCSVCVEWNGLTITRSKKPTRLVLVSASSQYEDDVAQLILHKHIPSTFATVGYISQHSSSSFPLMSAAEKFDFIEKFAFSDIDMTKMKSVLKAHTNEVQTSLVQATTQHNVYATLMKNAVCPIEPDVFYTPDEIESTYHLEKELVNDINRHETHISQLQEACFRHREMETKQTTLRACLAQLGADLHDSTERSLEFGDVDETALKNATDAIDNMAQYRAFRSLSDAVEREQIILDRLIGDVGVCAYKRDQTKPWVEHTRQDSETNLDVFRSQLQHVQQYERLSLSIASEKIGMYRTSTIVQSDIDITLSTISKLENELSYKKLTCPSCHTSLQIDNNVLLVSNVSSHSETAAASLSVEKKKWNLLKAEFAKCVEHESKLRILESDLLKCTKLDKTADELKVLIDELETYKFCQIGLESAHAQLVSSHRILVKNRDVAIATVSRLIAQKTECECTCDSEDESAIVATVTRLSGKKLSRDMALKSATQLSARITTATAELEGLQDALQLGRSSSDTLQSTRIQLDALKTDYEIVKKRMYSIQSFVQAQKDRNAYNTLHEQLDSAKLHERNMQTNVATAIRLKEKIVQSQGIAISQFIDQLNQKVQVHIDAFFSDHPMTITMSAFKDIESKAKISHTIKYKNREFETVLALSGGELNRVVMAYTLALGEIFNTPFYMFDESTSNLDEVTTTAILHYLQDNIKNAFVIMVAHQAIEGTYDQVIKL